MKRETADALIKELLECSGRLDRSVALARDTCTDEEFKVYRRAVARSMAEITEALVAISTFCPDVDLWEGPLKGSG